MGVRVATDTATRTLHSLCYYCYCYTIPFAIATISIDIATIPIAIATISIAQEIKVTPHY